MPLIFANEYGPYDRKIGKSMLKNNDSLLNDTVDTFNTFQKVITAPEVVKTEVVTPAGSGSAAGTAASAVLKSKKQY